MVAIFEGRAAATYLYRSIQVFGFYNVEATDTMFGILDRKRLYLIIYLREQDALVSYPIAIAKDAAVREFFSPGSMLGYQ